MLYGKIGVTIVYNFALRKFDIRGRWSATPKNRGRSKKTRGRTVLKNGGGSQYPPSKRQCPPDLPWAHLNVNISLAIKGIKTYDTPKSSYFPDLFADVKLQYCKACHRNRL